MSTNIIYILKVTEEEKDIFKIGITNKIEKRLKNIRTGNHRKVELLFTEEISEGIKIRDLENWLHSVFGDTRLEGEWFSDLSEKEIRKKILRFFFSN